LGDTPSRLYLSNVTNLAFHDLTPENHHVPPGANLLLGLGQKFIPTPRRTTGSKELNEHLFRFRRDLYRAVFWGEDSEEELSSQGTIYRGVNATSYKCDKLVSHFKILTIGAVKPAESLTYACCRLPTATLQ